MKRCYFVYTWDNDNTGLPALLNILKDKVETYTDGEIEVIYDKESFGKGEDFEEKEKLIYSSDSIVIFFSPEYKNIIVEQNRNRGSYREYEKIEDVKQKGIASIIPVIVSGNEKNAITAEFNRNIAIVLDINHMFVQGKKGKLKKKQEENIEYLTGKIIKETNIAYKKRDFEFASKEDVIETLFGESEANRKLPQKCMCKTDAYESVISQTRRYIIGRKGSGKTTFFELLENYDVDLFEKKFKVLKPIKAELINMEYAYNIISRYEVDDILFSLSRRLELFWEIYTYLCAIYIICLEEERYKIEDDRRFIFREAGDILRNEKLKLERLDSSNCHAALFASAIDTFSDFMQKDILSDIQVNSFAASLIANFDINNVMENYFGKNLYKKLKNAIIKCKKKIMIALDGFDTVSDDFRRRAINYLNSRHEDNKDEGEKRLNFEALFYRSMFTVFEKLRKMDYGIMNKISFCIIIPQDKIDQIKDNDRDFSKYNFTSLSWDAIDLLKMLVYRLEYVYNIENKGEENLKERFEYILKKYYSDVPLHIQMIPDDKNSQMDLFQFLLRLSFWRPRDIIKYFYAIYLASKNNVEKSVEVSQDIIKGVLYNKANDIIETEFYAEYRNVIINLEEIMDIFRGKSIIMDVNDALDLIAKQPFKTSMLRDFHNPINKIKILYELSAIGILISKQKRKDENLECELCFNYNEGLEPLRLLDNISAHEKNDINIVVNPIFSRKLSLVYTTKDIVEKYGWDYLYRNHARKSSIKRI